MFSHRVLQEGNETISVAVICHIVACVLHNSNIARLSLNKLPYNFVKDDAWHSEGLPVLPVELKYKDWNEVLAFWRNAKAAETKVPEVKADEKNAAASFPEEGLTKAQLTAALAAVSNSRGKPILRSRISFVGEGAAGKTSFIRALCSEEEENPASTIGINRSCVEFDISAVHVEANSGQVCCLRVVCYIFALVFAFESNTFLSGPQIHLSRIDATKWKLLPALLLIT
jgi:hypothetical protein